MIKKKQLIETKTVHVESTIVNIILQLLVIIVNSENITELL